MACCIPPPNTAYDCQGLPLCADEGSNSAPPPASAEPLPAGDGPIILQAMPPEMKEKYSRDVLLALGCAAELSMGLENWDACRETFVRPEVVVAGVALIAGIVFPELVLPMAIGFSIEPEKRP